MTGRSTDMTAPVAHFREMIAALESGRPIPDDVIAWWHDGCTRFAAGETPTLDRALGLRAQGINLPARTYAREARDAELVAAFALIEGRSRWARTEALARLIRGFELRTWPRVRDYNEPPERLTAAQCHLFHAFRACRRVPSSPSRLAEILRSNPRFSQ